jgi:hypothetical protein
MHIIKPGLLESGAGPRIAFNLPEAIWSSAWKGGPCLFLTEAPQNSSAEHHDHLFLLEIYSYKGTMLLPHSSWRVTEDAPEAR